MRALKVHLDQLFEETGFDGDDPLVLEAAIESFKRGGPALLDRATPYLCDYYRSTASEFTPEQRRSCGIPEIPNSADIWDYVRFRSPPDLTPGGSLLEPGRSYLSFEGEVSWESEHGLQLVFEDGGTVCKVGPYDGHVTVAHASAMPLCWASSSGSGRTADGEYLHLGCEPRPSGLAPSHVVKRVEPLAAGSSSRRRGLGIVQLMSERLPTFRYHPDPVATGSVVESSQDCDICNQPRGYMYVGPLYSTGDARNLSLCPWCIADGSAAKKLDAEFTDVGWGVPADVPASVLEDVSQKTPGFTSWQQDHWLYHCGDACAFLGRVGGDDLGRYPDALAMMVHENHAFGWTEEHSSEHVDSLAADGEATAYLFRCVACQAYLAFSDAA